VTSKGDVISSHVQYSAHESTVVQI